MKKLIIILSLLFVVITIWAQYPTYGYCFNDTIFTANQTADDSVYFKEFRVIVGGSVTFDFSTVSANDATITFGYSPDGVVLIPVSSGSFTLDITDSDLECYTFTTTADFDDVDTLHCKSFTKDVWSYKYIGWLLSKGSLTTDTVVIKYCK